MSLCLDNPFPFDIESAVEVPGWGNIIDDAITRGIYAYNTGGAAYALVSYGEGLKNMIAQKNWRSTDAADLLAFLQRQVFVERSLISNFSSKEVKLELECV